MKVNLFLLRVQELILTDSKNELFPIMKTQRIEFDILARKQILQRLLIALAELKASNTSENLLNEIK